MSGNTDNGKRKESQQNIGPQLPEHGVTFAPGAPTGLTPDEQLAKLLQEREAGSDVRRGDNSFGIANNVDYVSDREGNFFASVTESPAVFDKLAKDFGFSTTKSNADILRATNIKVERVDIMPQNLAKAKIRGFLDERFVNDDDKQVALILILKHLALNSSSVRSPDTIVYEVGGRPLHMSELRRHLGDESRRFFRAFADVVAEIIRADHAFAAAMAERYSVPAIDAIYCFDAADCMSRLTRDARVKIAKIKANTLKLSSFDARHVSDVYVKHNDTYGAGDVVEE